MKTVILLPFLLTATAVFAADTMKFVSPDNSSTLVVDKSGNGDLIKLKSEKAVHPLFDENFEPLFKSKLAEAFKTSSDKMGKIVTPTFTGAEWLSSQEVQVKGKSSVIINQAAGNAFTFTALVSKFGNVKDFTVTPVLESVVTGDRPRPGPRIPPRPPPPSSLEKGTSNIEGSGKPKP